jgi:hypothetical protein
MTKPPTLPGDKILTTYSSGKKAHNFAGLLMKAARQEGISEVRLLFAVLGRSFGRQGLFRADFFKFGLHRRALSVLDRDAFVTETEITRLNTALRAKGESSLPGLFDSKVLTELTLRGAGLPTSQTVAFARAMPTRMPFPVLTTAAAVEEFLRSYPHYPLFGKPDNAERGIGAASFLRLEGDDIILGDGVRAKVKSLSEEITRDYPDGYVFQALLRPHADLERLIGPVIGSLRIVTLKLRNGPEPLFVMLKMPGQGAMVDGGVSGSNAAAIVDPVTGKIRRAQLLSAPISEPLLHNHVTGAPVVGASLPDFDTATTLALDAHRLFKEQGLLGFDIMLTDQGPVINEINLNPGASLMQSAQGRGQFDENFKAKYREALAVQGVKLPLRGVRL